jgi:hypothetical protein
MTDEDVDKLRELAAVNGVEPDQHCCPTMAARIGLARRVDGAVPVLIWMASWNEYMVGVGADKPDYYPPEHRWQRVAISYCPWCGSRLSRSRKDEWYETLYSLGYQDPGEQDIPSRFQSDEWWRSPAGDS